MHLHIINGPNLNLLGTRNPEQYGTMSFEDFLDSLNYEDIKITYFQSNIEGEIINELHTSKANGIILNAGGYTHTSVAIRDAVEAITIPVVEVHISNITKRERFRHESLISPVAIGCIFGFGIKGYQLAIEYFQRHL
ncbi:MAG: type II 3-dehydroquinate dehydratase [Brumimicrobium sp.]|nr:type II 3-dehydroquinate dehydratase [Brumimicrobium sp.]MCO5269449.1 type II 3-dehydroquinate dehydratase [Brumimicrobium sp.]